MTSVVTTQLDIIVAALAGQMMKGYKPLSCSTVQLSLTSVLDSSHTAALVYVLLRVSTYRTALVIVFFAPCSWPSCGSLLVSRELSATMVHCRSSSGDSNTFALSCDSCSTWVLSSSPNLLRIRSSCRKRSCDQSTWPRNQSSFITRSVPVSAHATQAQSELTQS